MKNILILSHNIEDYLAGGSQHITELYRPGTDRKFLRALRKITLATEVGNLKFLNDWYTECAKYDCIILFDTGNADYLIRLIHKKAPKTRLILWYWNPIEKTIPIKKIKREYCEVWSYHEEDCRKYNLRYNTQIFIPDNDNESNDMSQKSLSISEQDVYFVGADKNRSQILHEIEMVLKANDISYKFVLIGTRDSKETSIPYSEPISAEESTINVKHSKAVIDIVEAEQATGLTLRPLEAAKYKKKLITNNKKITSIKFCNPNNIFIWGVDKIVNLKEFINSPYDKSSDSKIDYYAFEAWLDRFNR